MGLHLLALTICITWGAWVAVRDLQTFRIKNGSLVWGFCLIWPALFMAGERLHLTWFLILLIALFFFLGLISVLGMGDVKLFLVFAPWLHETGIVATLLLLISAAWLQFIIIWISTRVIPKRIAFAPAILLALTLNMAT